MVRKRGERLVPLAERMVVSIVGGGLVESLLVRGRWGRGGGAGVVRARAEEMRKAWRKGGHGKCIQASFNVLERQGRPGLE